MKDELAGHLNGQPPRSFRLDLGEGDRILLIIFAPMVTALFAAGGIAAYCWSPEDVWLRIARVLMLEAAFAIAFFSGLVSVWVTTRPRWARILLEKRLLRTLGWVFAIGATLTILLIWGLIVG